MTIPEMLDALIAAGQTERAIAARVGVSQATLNRLRNGVHRSTSYEVGRAIEALYGEVFEPDGQELAASG